MHVIRVIAISIVMLALTTGLCLYRHCPVTKFGVLQRGDFVCDPEVPAVWATRHVGGMSETVCFLSFRKDLPGLSGAGNVPENLPAFYVDEFHGLSLDRVPRYSFMREVDWDDPRLTAVPYVHEAAWGWPMRWLRVSFTNQNGPFVALEGWIVSDQEGRQGDMPVQMFPGRVLTLPCLITSVVHIVMGAVAYVAWTVLRRKWRIHRGLCGHCKYPLIRSSGRCPECGMATDPGTVNTA